MDNRNYTTPRLDIALRCVKKYLLEAAQARFKLDCATDPEDIAHWELEITMAEIQVARWGLYIEQLLYPEPVEGEAENVPSIP